MKRFCFYSFYILIYIFILTSCASNKYLNDTVAEEIDTVSDAIVTGSLYENDIIEDDEIASTEAVSTVDLQQEELYCSVDLNYDGITEDFYLCKDVRYDKFHIVMYDNAEKTIISDEIYINRVNSIDIYKTNDGDSSDYYCAVYQYGSYHNYIVACLFTGNEQYRSFNLRTYGEDFHNAINCYSYNVDMPKASFDELLADMRHHLNKYDNLEYIETINLDDYLTDDYSEEHLCDLAIVDGMTDISIYRVQNDIFGRDLKLSNGAYSYYSFKSPNVEVYKRTQKIREQNNELHNYYEAETGEYEYLLCIKALNEETAELVYLGTPNEDMIVSYYAYANVSYAPTKSGQDRDIEEFESIMNDPASFLKRDGWTYYDDIKLVKG